MTDSIASRQADLSAAATVNAPAPHPACKLSDSLTVRDYLKNDQSAHRRFHHLYEDLLM